MTVASYTLSIRHRRKQSGLSIDLEERWKNAARDRAGCPQCTKVFKQFGFLQQHMMREHKVHPKDCRTRIKTKKMKDNKGTKVVMTEKKAGYPRSKFQLAIQERRARTRGELGNGGK